MRTAGAVLATALAACGGPVVISRDAAPRAASKRPDAAAVDADASDAGVRDQADARAYGTVTIAMPAAEWYGADRELLRAHLPALARLGPAFALIPFEGDAGVVLRRFDSPDCAAAAASYVPATNTARVDPTCAPTATARRALFMHAIGHVLGLSHVCRREPPEAGDCVPGVRTVAVMNPHPPRGDAGIVAFVEVAGTDAVDAWQPADLDQYRDLHRR